MRAICVAAVVTVALLIVGCGGSNSAGPSFSGEPELTVGPNPEVPLVAVVSAETDEPAVIELTIDDGDVERVVVPNPTPGTEHEVPVLGLRPDHAYTIRVAALEEGAGPTDADSAAELIELTFTTPPLPDDFPPITVTKATAEPGDPSTTLFNISLLDPEDPLGARSWLVMLDSQGELVWYYDPGHGVGDARRMTNGNLLFLHGVRGMREIDMLGNTIADWTAVGHKDDLPDGSIPVDTDSFHHEVYELPEEDEADFLIMSSELRPYPDYPTDEVDPSKTESEAQVMGDVIVAFKRDGTIVQEWSLLDILDPYRMSYDTLDDSWQLVYEGETRDWSHGNGVITDPTDGGLIISLRNQDATVKIDRETGELVWILGPPERWEEPWSEALLTPSGPEGYSASDFEWSFHQHAPVFTPNGGMLLFDNGNGRAIPPEPVLDPQDRYSRLVEYEIDEEALTISQIWDYGGPDDRWYSGALGDADYIAETDTVLGVDGFKGQEDGPIFARVFEITRDDLAEIVFEVIVRDESTDDPVGWIVYRAERLDSIYP